ncbi:hypothetical protein ACVIJ6_001087 [Bradyrhizobium sp. USDA 4369]
MTDHYSTKHPPSGGAAKYTYKKLVDTNTPLPNSGSTFQEFQPPVFDGSTVVFCGSNQTYEGLYAVMSDGSLVTVSDNHTTIPQLQGPPTSAQDDQPDAYVQSVSGQLSYCGNELSTPRPAVIGNQVIFFAANWPQNLAGIFKFDLKTQSLSASDIVDNSTGLFAGGQFSQPTVSSLGAVYFSAAGASNTPPPGVYAVPVTGGTDGPAQVLDITTAATPSGIQIANLSNSQQRPLLPVTQLFVCGLQTGTSGNEGIFCYGAAGLELVAWAGQAIGTYTIATGAGTFWTEIAYAEQLLAFNVGLLDSQQDISTGLVALPQPSPTSTPVLIATNMQEIPGGGGQFDGNEFATPPVCDGTRVVFTGAYFPTQGFGEVIGLFVWNAKTGQSAKILDSNDKLGSAQFSNIYLQQGCFVGGQLVGCLLLSDGTSGIYQFDLSNY